MKWKVRKRSQHIQSITTQWDAYLRSNTTRVADASHFSECWKLGGRYAYESTCVLKRNGNRLTFFYKYVLDFLCLISKNGNILSPNLYQWFLVVSMYTSCKTSTKSQKHLLLLYKQSQIIQTTTFTYIHTDARQNQNWCNTKIEEQKNKNNLRIST